MKKILFIALAFFTLTSCTEIISDQQSEVTPRVVINAKLIKDSVCVVKLTRTHSYYDSSPVPTITNATITLTVNSSTTESLTHIGNGVYKGSAIIGTVNSMYTINVVIDGNTYTANATMLPVTPIDSLKYYYTTGTTIQDEGYYPTLYAIEPPNVHNYYMFRYFRNDTLLSDSGDYSVSDDRYVTSNIDGVPFPYTYRLNDVAKLEMYSLDQAQYQFYTDFLAQLNSDGGFFSTPPTNPSTNFSGRDVIGVFQVSDMSVKSITIL
jgi:hypothetical protein